MRTKTETLDSPRIRFNWGFWDARADKEAGRRDRREIQGGELFALPCDGSNQTRAYRDGYVAGRKESFAKEATSDEAWKDRLFWEDMEEAMAI